jgi:hypothetical protein
MKCTHRCSLLLNNAAARRHGPNLYTRQRTHRRSIINSTDTPSQSVQSPSQTRRDPFELSPVRLEASRAKGHPHEERQGHV